MSHIESDRFSVTRLPDWSRTQLVLICVVFGAYVLGLFFHQTSAVPEYKAILDQISLLARAEAKGKPVDGRLLAMVEKYRKELPRPGPDALTAIFAWSPSEALGQGRVWQILTYPLLHDPTPRGLFHCLNTILALWLLGGVIQRKYGPGRLAILLAGAAVVGALGAAALWPQGRFVGGTSVVLALCVVFIFSAAREDLLIGRFLPQATSVGVFFCLATIIQGLIFGQTHDCEPATPAQRLSHLGLLSGAFWGFLFYKLEPRLFERWLSWRVRRQKRLRTAEADIRARVDTVLDKICTQGKSALTRRERAFLRGASRFLKRRGHKDS